MNKISVGIVDEHKIVQEGLISILSGVEDIEVSVTLNDRSGINEMLKQHHIHVLIINLHNLDTQFHNLISQITISFPKISILVFSVNNDEEQVLRTIKAGAKGFLAKDTGGIELVEAIYTLRNGHDYFSKSITHLLLNKYIARLKSDDDSNMSNIRNLSSREIEILKLWGNGYSNQDIADKLFISVRTVESHKNHIMQKLNLKTIVDLVKFAIKNNLVEI